MKSFNLKQHVHRKGHTLDLLITRAYDDLVTSIEIRDPAQFDCKLRLPLEWASIKYRKIRSIDADSFNDDLKNSTLLSRDHNGSSSRWIRKCLAEQIGWICINETTHDHTSPFTILLHGWDSWREEKGFSHTGDHLACALTGKFMLNNQKKLLNKAENYCTGDLRNITLQRNITLRNITLQHPLVSFWEQL